MTKKPQEGKIEGLGNIDQIREIIFGSQMREVTQRFTKIENAMDAMRKSFEEQIPRLKTAISNENQNNMELIETKIKNLASMTKEERDALKDELNRSDKRINMAMLSLSEEQTTKLALLKKDYLANAERLEEEMAALKRTVMEELTSQLGSMEDVKVSRDVMAEVLLEMAMKIKGEGLDIPMELPPVEAPKQK